MTSRERKALARRLDPNPLREVLERALESHSTAELAETVRRRIGGNLKVHYRTIVRIREGSSVNLQTADNLCTALEIHPALIWGEQW
jgi:hypothetical protein